MAKKKHFNDIPFPYHTEIELEIATLTNLGLGLGRVKLPPETCEGGDPSNRDERGWVVMVPFCLPGERVRARIFRNRSNFSEADLVEVLVPSPDRVQPRCALFGVCGGCQYQHLSYAAQLTWKRRQVEELLQHMAGVAHPVNAVIGSPKEFAYRSKITPHFQIPRTEPDTANPDTMPIGFLRQGSRFEIVDVPRCEIATDAINARLGTVRDEVRSRARSFKRGATLLLREASGQVVTDYDAVITETVGSLKFRFLARDFFQNNPFILPAFTDYVRSEARSAGARFLVDAYCGSGLFALSCAASFERVAGVEISESSIAFAKENARANDIRNAQFEANDASAIFAGLPFPAHETTIIIDPPRKGCDLSFLQQLFAYGPKTVVYVSCDPATQMRDLRHFIDAGYTLSAVQPFDLFPQTRHLECVITLRKNTGADAC